MPRPSWKWILLLLLPLLGSGCGTLGVAPGGTIRSVLVEPSCSTDERPLVLTFNRLGNLTLNGRSLDLPAAREDRYFGVSAVDAAHLPPMWRPEHLKDGGVAVSLLRKASPLAVAGLRPFDRVQSANGRALKSPQELMDALNVPHDQTVKLAVTRHDGSKHVVNVNASDRVDEETKNHVPFLFEQHDSSVGHSFGLGPLDLLFYYRVRTEHRYIADARVGHSAYTERFEWGALGNIVKYERERDVASGTERSRLRLLWILSLGDL